MTELLPRLAAAFDEPLGDEAALPQYVVCELARRHVTVALTGDGGDEAFAGYERYAAVGLAARLRGAGRRRRPRARCAGRAAASRARGANRAGRLLEVAALPAGRRYGRLMEVFPATLRAELWEPGVRAGAEAAWELLGRAGGRHLGPPAPRRPHVPPRRPAAKADIASMAHSLELRSPLLDHSVARARHLAARPAEDRRAPRQGRAPPGVRRRAPARRGDRGKTGFGVPIARWFREELRELAGDVLLDETARARGLFRPAAVEQLLDEHAPAAPTTRTGSGAC